jgi:hypothetical protein
MSLLQLLEAILRFSGIEALQYNRFKAEGDPIKLWVSLFRKDPEPFKCSPDYVRPTLGGLSFDEYKAVCFENFVTAAESLHLVG